MKILIDTEKETICVDGAIIALAVLRTLANPDAALFYKFVRDKEVIVCNAFKVEQQQLAPTC